MKIYTKLHSRKQAQADCDQDLVEYIIQSERAKIEHARAEGRVLLIPITVKGYMQVILKERVS